MEETKPIKLALTVDEGVHLSFGPNVSQLRSIHLTENRVAELIANGVVNRKTIYDVNEITLITQTKFKTQVKLAPLDALGVEESILIHIDSQRTSALKGLLPIVRQHPFTFVVDTNYPISRADLYSLHKAKAESNRFGSKRK